MCHLRAFGKLQVLIRLQAEEFDFCPQRGNARVPPKVFGTSARGRIVGHNQQSAFIGLNPAQAIDQGIYRSRRRCRDHDRLKVRDGDKNVQVDSFRIADQTPDRTRKNNADPTSSTPPASSAPPSPCQVLPPPVGRRRTLQVESASRLMTTTALVTGRGRTERRILQSFVRCGRTAQFAFSVRSSSRRIMTMRFRPADIE